jgi:hypothetical protein
MAYLPIDHKSLQSRRQSSIFVPKTLPILLSSAKWFDFCRLPKCCRLGKDYVSRPVLNFFILPSTFVTTGPFKKQLPASSFCPNFDHRGWYQGHYRENVASTFLNHLGGASRLFRQQDNFCRQQKSFELWHFHWPLEWWFFLSSLKIVWIEFFVASQSLSDFKMFSSVSIVFVLIMKSVSRRIYSQ